jgi:hypothetical protein
MSTEPFGAELTERYLRSRELQHFRGQHDGEYFFILKTDFKPLHVHLETPAASGMSLLISITTPTFFPATNRPRLTRLAKRFNRRSTSAEAVVYRSIDPTRFGVVAKDSIPVSPGIQFQEFAGVVDDTIASAARFFGELASVVELPVPHKREAWLPDAS